MRTSIAQIAAAFALASAPSLVHSATIRHSLLLPCLGAGLLLLMRRNGGMDPAASSSIRKRLKAQGERLSLLTERVKDAMRKTEQAVLDINARFMNIASRARTHQRTDPKNPQRSNAAEEQMPAGAAGNDLNETCSGGEHGETKDEVAALTRDIHGAITALQFEDIVRQQLAHVVSELQQVREEQAEMERVLAASDIRHPEAYDAAPVSGGTGRTGRDRKRLSA